MNTEITEIKRIGVPATTPSIVRGACVKWVVAPLPFLVCAVAGRNTAAWVQMWLVSLSLFAGAKWIVIFAALPLTGVRWTRQGGFLFLWPGMNPRRFFFGTAQHPTEIEWSFAMGNTALGAAMTWCGAGLAAPSHPLLAGWIGMLGIVLLLHFGVFHLVSNLWRIAGIDAPPIMANPIQSRALAEFWGRRWNKGFNDLMAPLVFSPIARTHGFAAATLAVFLVSGVLHEIVISLPARGGFGLPTVYFAIQAAGLLIERSAFGRRLGLGRGICGRLFTVLITAGPAYWLFNPVFVRHVILPMLRAIGAI